MHGMISSDEEYHNAHIENCTVIEEKVKVQ
jgi:hypothetical protein